MSKIFAPKRKRGKKSDWFRLFAQYIDENGVVWVDEVAEQNGKTVGEVRAKVNSLGEEFGEEKFYRMVTAASHEYYSGRTCVRFDQHEVERRRKSRNKKDYDLLQLQWLADKLPDVTDEDTDGADTDEDLSAELERTADTVLVA